MTDRSLFDADLKLARAILARDRKATARFVDLHAEKVHAYVWRRLSPKVETVDDIVQEIFLASWRSLSTYSGESPLEAWLLAIARFKVEDHYRRVLSHPLAAFEQEMDSPQLSVSPTFDSDLDQGRDIQRAAAVLDQLPYEYALVLRWRYWQEESVRNMASLSGRTDKAIERMLARAREKFKQRWLQMAVKSGGVVSDGR